MEDSPFGEMKTLCMVVYSIEGIVGEGNKMKKFKRSPKRKDKMFCRFAK